MKMKQLREVMFNNLSIEYPKKNYEVVLDMQKQLNDIFKKNGVTNRQVFLAGEVENVPRFTNISKTMSANRDEEVLTAITFYRNRKHRDRRSIHKILSDENYLPLIKEYKNLLTPESGIVVGEFGRPD